MIRLNEYLSTKVINKKALNYTIVKNVNLYKLIINDFGVNLHSDESIEYNIKYMKSFSQEMRSNRKLTEKGFCNLLKYYANTKVDVGVRQITGYIQIEFSLEDIDLFYHYDENSRNTFDYVVSSIKSYAK